MANKFHVGSVPPYLRNWENMISDPVIITIVRYGLELQSPSEIIGTTEKNGVIADTISNVKLFLETIW